MRTFEFLGSYEIVLGGALIIGVVGLIVAVIEERIRKAKATYTVIYEHVSDNNWGATVPDLPGLAVGGRTKKEVERLIQEGIVFHIEGLKEDGLPVPPPQHS